MHLLRIRIEVTLSGSHKPDFDVFSAFPQTSAD